MYRTDESEIEKKSIIGKNEGFEKQVIGLELIYTGAIVKYFWGGGV